MGHNIPRCDTLDDTIRPPGGDGVSMRDIVTPGGLRKPALSSFDYYFNNNIFLVCV
jgi:hypothetical protein